MLPEKMLIALLCFAPTATQSSSAKQPLPESMVPEWTVPLATKPPVIDGRIELAEWDHAVSATGLVDYLSRFMVARQARVWLTYDRQYLYVAMRSPLPGHGRLLAKQKRNDVRWVFADDAIEVTIQPHRDRAGESGFKAIYHMIFNSIDTVYDIRRCKGIGQNFLNWNTSAERGHSIRDGHWEFEIRIPASDFGLEEIASGTTWRIAIVRNWKNPSSWATITPGYSCNNSTTYVKAHLVESAPVFHLEGLGALREGKLGLEGRIVSPDADEKQFTVHADIKSLKGNRLLADVGKAVSAAAGKPGEVRVMTGFEMAEQNVLGLSVRPEAGADPIFKHTFLFRRMTEDERKALAQWNAPPQPKKRYRCSRYHHVERGILEIEFDFSEYVQRDGVRRAQVSLLEKGSSKAARQKEEDVGDDGKASVAIPVGELSAGAYTVRTESLDPAGEVLSKQDYPFEIKEWPWLGNTLGKSHEILPPHSPLGVEGRTVSCWGRSHTFGNDGLLSQIESQGQSLLARPQTLRAVVDGEKVATKVVEPFAFSATKPHEVRGSAALRMGKLAATVSVTMEYDGWILYRMTLGKAEGLTVDSLDLELPLALPLSTLYHVVGERHTDTIAGEIPAGDGVVWDSRVPQNSDILGTFQPYVWVGNEKAGLSWMAESDRGWHTKDDLACIDLLRDTRNSVMRLRFRLINIPTSMDQAREIVFGIMATPSKPMPEDWRRWSLWDPGAPRRPSKVFGIDFTRDWCHGFGGSFYPKNHDHAIVEYPLKMMARGYTHPTFYTGFGYIALNYPEVQYFKTDWLGKDFTTYSHVDRFANRKYWGNDPKAYITTGAALTDSYLDFMAYYYDQLLKKTAFRAIYYDLFNPSFTDRPELGAYIRDDGQIQKASDLFRKRAHIKRIATVMHHNGLEILQIVHMTGTTIVPNLSFAQIAFDAEMRFPPKGRDHMDTWTFDLLRAETMGKQYGLVPFFLPGGKRDLIGMLAAHDILECRGNTKGGMSHEYQTVLADFGVGVGNRDVEFVGYWANRTPVTTGDSNVFCSFYRRPGKVFLIFVNRRRETKAISAKLDWRAIGVQPTKCYDPQRRQSIDWDATRGRIDLEVGGHDYRVIVAE